MEQMTDGQKVFQVLELLPDLTARLIAQACGWRGPTGVLNTARVHRALMQLAADRKIWQDPSNKRWKLVRKQGDTGTPHP